MKTFVVGTRKKSKVARLAAYESKHLENNRKSGVGLSYQDILGGYDYEPVFVSTDKQECLDYMDQNLKPVGWLCFDNSTTVKKLKPGKKMYAVIGNRAAGEISEVIVYHTGNPNVRLSFGYDSVQYESTRKADCDRFIRGFYKEMEEARKLMEQDRS